MSGHDLRVQGCWGSQAHEGGKVVSSKHRPPLPPKKIPLTRPQGHFKTDRIKSMTQTEFEPATFQFVAHCLNKRRHLVSHIVSGSITVFWFGFLGILQTQRWQNSCYFKNSSWKGEGKNESFWSLQFISRVSLHILRIGLCTNFSSVSCLLYLPDLLHTSFNQHKRGVKASSNQVFQYIRSPKEGTHLLLR